MDYTLTKIAYWNALSFIFFVGFLWIINVQISDMDVPMRDIIAVSFLFSISYFLYFIGWWWVSSEYRNTKIIGLIFLMVLVFLHSIFSHMLIYSVLPYFGVVLNRPSEEFNLIEFQTRILTATVFLLLLSGVMAFVFRFLKNRSLLNKSKLRNEELRSEISHIRRRVATRHLSPHFIENVIALTMGRLTIHNHQKYTDHLVDLASLIHYAIDMDQLNKTVDWEREWGEVMKLLRLGKLVFGECSMIANETMMSQDVALPIGILLMPVENALKYGSISDATPLHLRVEQSENKWFFTVENAFRQEMRDTIASSKTGYVLMRTRIDEERRPINISTAEDHGQFHVTISGVYSE